MKYSECRTEQSFKMEWIRRNRKDFLAVFPIETEETVKGFPDVLIIENDNKAEFMEFKKARNGYIKFQPTQPAFYKAYSKLMLHLMALVENKGKVHLVSLDMSFVLAKLKGTDCLDLRPFCSEYNEVD